MIGFLLGFLAAYVLSFVVLGACVAFSYLRSDRYPTEAADPVDEHFKTSARDEELDQLNALWARPAYIKEQSNG